jgi:cyclic-di-GMP-binding biofilm dispersal mediator protein
MHELTGKTALVIGGSRGIGAAIVESLSAKGAHVTFTYAGAREAASRLVERSGAQAVQSDAADRDSLFKVIGEHGPLDILVFNAGVFLMGDALELDSDAVDRMIDLNARAPYHAAVEAARKMPDGGRIVVIGSSIASYVASPGVAAYAMTKAAVQGMVRGLARDFGPRGITVNIVNPGPTDTDMNPSDGPMADLMHGFMALKRHTGPEDVADLVAYVTSPAARSITGAVLAVDGGWAA